MAVVLLTALGIIIILIVLWDLFETLFDPDGQGLLAEAITNGVWSVMRRSSGPFASYAGPVAYLTVIFLWVAMLLAGWALVFWPRMPDHFAFDPGLDPAARSALADALYLSLVNLTTLGYGDITPESGWLRRFAPIQAFTGFLLLSAAITWILHIYQELKSRRMLAHSASLLREAIDSGEMSLSDIESDSIERLFSDLTSQTVRITGGLRQFPISRVFRNVDRRQSIELACPFLFDLAEVMSRDCYSPGLRLRAHMLHGALTDLARILNAHLELTSDRASTQEVLTALAVEHRRAIGLGED